MHSRIEPSGCGRRGVPGRGRGIVWGIVVLLAVLLFSNTAVATTEYIVNMTYVSSDNPTTNYGTSEYGQVRNRTQYASYKITYIELPSNSSNLQDLTLHIWTTMSSGYIAYMKVYNTGIFVENTVTWNTKPDFQNEIYNYTQSNGYEGWISIPLNNANKYISIYMNEAGNKVVYYCSEECSWQPYSPYITYTPPPSATVTVSCPVGWCYAASNYSSKTLLQLDTLFSTDVIQGHYNATSQKYESHRSGYTFNENAAVAQKEGYYYYFSSLQNITTAPGSTPSITLKTGWNLVANYGTTNRTLADLKTSIGANATQAQYYNRTTKTWVSTGTQSVPAMESFMAYVNASTVWSD